MKNDEIGVATPKRTFFRCEVYPETDGSCDVCKYKVNVIDFSLMDFIITLKNRKYEVDILGKFEKTL